jgi:hypothetical protein
LLLFLSEGITYTVTLYLQQAYTNELENKVSLLEEENERLKRQKVLCHPHFASKCCFPPCLVGADMQLPISCFSFILTFCFRRGVRLSDRCQEKNVIDCSY